MIRYLLKHRDPNVFGGTWMQDRASSDLETILDEARHSVSIGLGACVCDRDADRDVFHEKPIKAT